MDVQTGYKNDFQIGTNLTMSNKPASSLANSLVLLLSLEQGEAELAEGGSAKKSKSVADWLFEEKFPKSDKDNKNIQVGYKGLKTSKPKPSKSEEKEA